jgi:hypothetical protein
LSFYFREAFMSTSCATVTTEVLERSDGRPIACIDATGLVVFAYQQPDGSCVVDMYTRDDTVSTQLHVLLDGEPLALPTPASPAIADTSTAVVPPAGPAF